MYELFKRSAKNFEEFAFNRKIYVSTVETIDEAQQTCSHFNNNRTVAEKYNNTKLEFRKI